MSIFSSKKMTVVSTIHIREEINNHGSTGQLSFINYHTWESFASEPLFVKNTLPISLALNMLRISFARSCNDIGKKVLIIKAF